MKPHQALRISSLIPTLAAGIVSNAFAADRYWDGGTTNIGTNGDGVSAYSAGNWSTSVQNWDQGSGQAHVVWNNSNLDNAIFGGTAATASRTVTLTSAVTVNQLKITTGNTTNAYTIGVGTDTANPLTFGGSYNETTNITIDASLSGNSTVAAKITGTITGGLIIKHGSNITTPGASGRMYLSNANSDFVGDVTVLGGNIHLFSGAAGTATASRLGNAANKVYLKGGAIFNSGNLATNAWTRETIVETASGIGTNITAAGTQVNDFTGKISGSGNLTRYANLANSATAVSEVRFSGDMSGYTGTIENTVPTLVGAALASNSIMVIQTTATSGGGWKLTGGTLKLNTTSDTHIANGAGKSDLVVNGGTLDMNGKSETINGLSGTGGVIQNQLAATASTLTLGDGDATASYSGAIRDNGGTGGTVALTKIGAGVQTLGGSSTYTGNTLVSGGTLLVSGSLGNTAVTVGTDARIGGGGTLGGTLHFDDGADFQFSTTQTLTVNGASVTFGGFSIADIAGLDNTVDNGTYTLIGGTAVVSTTNLANVGLANAYDLGNGKAAFFEIGSLKVTVVPEPGAILLGGLGLLGFLHRRRA